MDRDRLPIKINFPKRSGAVSRFDNKLDHKLDHKLDFKLDYKLGKEFENYQEQARLLFQDTEKLDELLLKLELKLRYIPKVGNKLGDVVVLAAMLKAYIRREYTAVPRRTILALIAALLYVVSTFDFMPDFTPALGFVDDATVVAFTVHNALKDIEDFKEWQRETGRR